MTDITLTWLFVISQILYLLTIVIDGYVFSLPVDRVDTSAPLTDPPGQWPYIVLFYPVVRELEATMRATFSAIGNVQYPASRCKVIAIPDASDTETVTSLHRLAAEFPFVDVLEVPPTSDPTWQIVWDAWEANPKAYWWHRGAHAGVQELPPLPTRALIYGFYHTAANLAHERSLLVSSVDAGSRPPRDHFKAAAIGIKRYDVLQAQTVADNQLASTAASLHAFDDMCWGGSKYAHLSAHTRQPYWLLGQAFFLKSRDLVALGGFHPWIPLDGPEMGLRFWANGRRLGVIADPLIEQTPLTLRAGVAQRTRWVCGVLQSLSQPLNELGFTRWERYRSRLVFLPWPLLWVSAFAIPFGVWAVGMTLADVAVVPLWTLGLAVAAHLAFIISLSFLYANAWNRASMVLTRRRDRLRYMLRVNPISLMIWWVLWLLPLALGLRRYLLDLKLARTSAREQNANTVLVREQLSAR